MHQALRLHPDSLSSVVTHIDVDVVRPHDGSLLLRYVVTGRMGELRLPPVAAAAHTDELWQHTCFEAFVGSSVDAAYYEFNFAPSTEWAAYRFGSYRNGMRVATETSAPRIEVKSGPEHYTLQAEVALDSLSL